MRFAGCCNISCKRIDAVEHSDDLGASRKGRNLPTTEKQSTLQKIVSPQRRGSKNASRNASGDRIPSLQPVASHASLLSLAGVLADEYDDNRDEHYD